MDIASKNYCRIIPEIPIRMQTEIEKRKHAQHTGINTPACQSDKLFHNLTKSAIQHGPFFKAD
jgi:hypothetical protein